MDVPEDAEIGTDGEGFALLAILGTNVHWLEVGHIPNAEQLYAEAIKLLILERLRRIDAAGGETETGVIIVTFQGYVCSLPTSIRRLYSRIKNRRTPSSPSLQTSYTIRRSSFARDTTSG